MDRYLMIIYLLELFLNLNAIICLNNLEVNQNNIFLS